MNIQQIDIDEHLVIPTPTGQKEQLATIVAIENGYTETIENLEEKTFEGSAEEIDAKIASFTNNQRLLNVVEGVLTYEDKTPITNPETAVEFGKQVIMNLIGTKVRTDVRSFQLKELQASNKLEEEAAMAAVNTSLDNDLAGLKAL